MYTHYSSMNLDAYSIPSYHPVCTVILLLCKPKSKKTKQNKTKTQTLMVKLSFENQLVIRKNAFGILCFACCSRSCNQAHSNILKQLYQITVNYRKSSTT